MGKDDRVIFVHNNGFISNYREEIAKRMEAKGEGKIKGRTTDSPEETAASKVAVVVKGKS